MGIDNVAPSRLALPRVPVSVWIATLVLNFLGLAMPLAILQLFGRVIPAEATDTLVLIVVGLIIVAVLEFILREARSRILHYQTQLTAEWLNYQLAEKQLFADPGQTEEVSKRRRFLRMQAGSTVAGSLSGTGRLHAIEIPFALLALAAVYLIAGPLVYVPLAGLLFLTLVGVGMFYRQSSALEDRSKADESRYEFWTHVLNNIGHVKAAQMEAGLRDRYQAYQRKSSAASMRATKAANFFDSISTVAGYSFSSATVLMGAALVIAGLLQPAELAACTMLSARAVQPLLQLIRFRASGASTKGAEKYVMEGLMVPMVQARAEGSEIPLRGEIKFQDVTVRASEMGRSLLRSASFDIQPGTVTKLASASQSAPDTVMRVLLAEAIPEAGRVTLDGHEPRALTERRGSGGLVYVSEEPTIFNATIIENIAGIAEAQNIQRAYGAADLIGITEFVNTLPYGFDTHMRETGMHESSTGFLQQINLARAIAQDPAVLMLSDCCSKLDDAMKARAVQALRQVSEQISVIAYDPSGAFDRIADQTISLGVPQRQQSLASFIARKAA